MSHPSLSTALNAFIDTAESNNGFELTNLPENSLFEVHTQNSTYTIVVLDSARSAIALIGTRKFFEEPDMYSFHGSTWAMGASSIKVGWVGVGLHLRMQSLDGELITTTKLKSFVLLNDPEYAKAIRDKAEARRPGALQPATKDELQVWQADFDRKIEEDFAGEHLTTVQAWLAQFCIRGKCNAASFFAAAKEVGKLREALDLMPRHFISHWMYKAPEIRGDVITPSDGRQWTLAFQEVGVPLPNQG